MRDALNNEFKSEWWQNALRYDITSLFNLMLSREGSSHPDIEFHKEDIAKCLVMLDKIEYTDNTLGVIVTLSTDKLTVEYKEI